VFSKDEYLSAIACGELKYLIFEPDSVIAVRLYGLAAVIRYRSRLEIVREGNHNPLRTYWHTDFYEKRAGLWQAVWSQATCGRNEGYPRNGLANWPVSTVPI
jgi:Domain of unknown function (DUF4440)